MKYEDCFLASFSQGKILLPLIFDLYQYNKTILNSLRLGVRLSQTNVQYALLVYQNVRAYHPNFAIIMSRPDLFHP